MIVPLWLLPACALLFVIGAGSVVRLRGLGKGRVTREAAATVAAGTASVVPGICFYAIGTQFAGETAWRNAGAACFLVFPLVSVIVLSVHTRRRGFQPGSSIAAFLFGLMAVLLIGAWATLSWKGPRGGWGAIDILIFASSVVLIYSAAVCLGWWCGRSIRQANA
jgi:hypothetical protein